MTPETFTCMCCGFTSTTRQYFMHPPDGYVRGLERKNAWICRSELHCRQRTGT